MRSTITHQKSIIVMLSLLLLTGCSIGDDNKKLNKTPFKQTSKNSELTGEWSYNFPFFYSKLTLRNDGTFKFHDQGHYGQNYTEGIWMKKNKGVVLTSYESFITKIILEKNITNEQSSNGKPSKVPAPALPGPHDTIRVYFNAVGFELRGDTLLNLGDSPTKNEYQFVRKKTTANSVFMKL